MNLLLISFVFLTIFKQFSCESYSTKFDNIDVEILMKNERLLQNHYKCLIDGEACTPEAKDLREKMPEIMETCCGKCSEKHKEDGTKLTKFLIANKPLILKKLLDKYDPDKKYREKCAVTLERQSLDI